MEGISYWYGRATWVARHSRADPVGELLAQLNERGATWAPLRAGMFAGDRNRAEAALVEYQDAFAGVARNRG